MIKLSNLTAYQVKKAYIFVKVTDGPDANYAYFWKK